MIDQLVSGLPLAPQPVNSAARAASAEQDGPPDSFEDIVSKAGQQNARQDRQRGGDEATPAESEADAANLPDALPRAAFDLGAALRGLASSADGRARLATFRDALKAADADAQAAGRQDAVMARLVEKLKEAARQAQATADDMQPDAPAPLSPADELGRLLGLSAVKDADARPDRKAIAAEKAGADKEEDGGAVAARSSDAKAETPHAAGQALALPDVPRGADAGADDVSSRPDTVRLVSADGRGRPVDIALPRESQKDGDRSAANARIDTAIVLDARRYLGFSPDGNATALANAAKADPTWSAALGAMQRADLATLGNTVTEVNTLKLQMNPENLGAMVASLKLKGEELTVELRVDSIEAYRHLSADHDDIVKALQDQGFSIDKVTVQLNATDRTDAGADRDAARQGQARQEGQGGQPDRNGGRQDSQPHRMVDRGAADALSGDGGADAPRSGNIYL